MKILFIGDVMGYSALNFLKENLPNLKRENQIAVCIANGENSAPDGLGITVHAAKSLYSSGVDIITLGNHFRSKKRDIIEIFDDRMPVVRPLNIPTDIGSGYMLFDMLHTKIGIVNLSGRAFINMEMENPFLVINSVIDELKKSTPIILVDFHAEATSEKYAFFEYVKGKVTAVLGTHTHVQTSDEQLREGTAYITDVGMTGPRPSILGMDATQALNRFLSDTSDKLSVAEGKILLNSVIITVDPETGFAKNISRLNT